MLSVGILGAGTWGIALARMLDLCGRQVTVWSALEEEIRRLSRTRRHPKLPGMEIPPGVCFTSEIARACREKDIIVFAVPSLYVRATAAKAAEYIQPGQVIVDVAKGMEAETLMTLTEVIGDEINKEIPLVALSGPTHAEEVAMDLPTTIVSACEDIKIAEFVPEVFTGPFMRVYTNTDKKGVEISGALKNIIALAAGLSKGLGYGDNTKAAIITRGIAEISRLGQAMGCQNRTFSGLAGIGDLVVTCTSEHSRNHQAGVLLGQGYSARQAVEKVGMVVEGIHMLPAAMRLSQTYAVELPIACGVNDIVNHGLEPRLAVNVLMDRKLKNEHESDCLHTVV